MDLKSKHSAPVLADPVPTNISRLSLPSSLLPYSTPAASFVSGLSLSRKKPIPGKLDDVRANGWLDAMIASSPPHKKLIKDSHNQSSLDESDAGYHAWMLKYPSALTHFDQIAKNAEGKQVVLFLDYDGTLSPIVDDPDCAFMSTEMRDAVRDVAHYFSTAIISGRCRDQVYELVGLTELYYAGSHGMDIMVPVTHPVSSNDHPNGGVKSTDEKGKEVNLFQPASEFIPMIDGVFSALVEKTKGIEGAKVENNKFSASVHYRRVDECNWTAIAQCVHDVLKDYPRLRLTHGRKVLEVRPVIDWDKGKAVEFLLESLGLNNCNDVFPIYVGDDRTDEDAFKVLREGSRGNGILVSSTPKESNAFYSLRNPLEVMDFLKSIVSWKKSTEV